MKKYKKGDNKKELEQRILEAKRAHENKTAVEHLHVSGGGTYIKDLVYGANDGIITTFAVVSGVAGAGLDPKIVLILGFANLLADGLSMAVGNYLGTRSEEDYIRREQKMEEWEVEYLPKEETAEIRAIYTKKGFEGKNLDHAVEIITSDKKRWVDVMMVEELGLIPLEGKSHAVKNGIATFIAFACAGILPLLPYVFGAVGKQAFYIAIIMTAVTQFTVGSARVLITKGKWWRAGLEMLLVGFLAAIVAYGIGAFIERLTS